MFCIITVILCVCDGGRDEGGDRGMGMVVVMVVFSFLNFCQSENNIQPCCIS